MNARISFLMLFGFILVSACGPVQSSCQECKTASSELANCDQIPLPSTCIEEEPPSDVPPPTLAPSSGTYEGYGTIVGHVGPVTAGCWPVSSPYAPSRLFMRLVINGGVPDDGTGNVTVTSGNVDDYSFQSVATQLGGSSTNEQEIRVYSLRFSTDLTQIMGRATYTRNEAATNRSQCSGYIFDTLYRKL